MMPAVIEMPRTAKPVHIVRFDRKTRMLHIVVMVTFLGLAATGMPLLFSEAPWARVLAMLFGGFHGAGLVHRVFGAALLAAVVFHVADVFWRAFVRGEKGLFWGPDSMVPQPKDVADLYGQMKWFVGLGPQPRFEHFTYWEKFDYWAVLWGTVIMGAAGLILWFPQAASQVFRPSSPPLLWSCRYPSRALFAIACLLHLLAGRAPAYRAALSLATQGQLPECLSRRKKP